MIPANFTRPAGHSAPVVIIDQKAPLMPQHPGEGYFLLFRGERAVFSRIHLRGWSRKFQVVKNG